MINIEATGQHAYALAILEICELAGATVRDANAFWLAGMSPRAVAEQLAARLGGNVPHEWAALVARFSN